MGFWSKVADWFGWERVRARDTKGRYIADDPKTAKNEAYTRVYKEKTKPAKAKTKKTTVKTRKTKNKRK
tara:strand:- start:1346 stop:1552 length:207 start_codon:yes stop_codon:yes gene_type:complete